MFDHVSIVVEKIGFAREFFSDMFGFRLIRQISFDWGEVYFLTDKNGFTLQLTCPKEWAEPVNPYGHICFSVPVPRVKAYEIKERYPSFFEAMEEVNNGNWMIKIAGIEKIELTETLNLFNRMLNRVKIFLSFSFRH